MTDVPALGDGAAQVWWARPAAAHAGLDALLSPAELGRRAALRRQEDRDRLTVAYGLARLVLAAMLGADPAGLVFDRACPRCGDPTHGKPRLASTTGLAFSISHSGHRVAVSVVRDAEVGVDVEQLEPRLDVAGLSGQVLAPAEAAALGRVAAADRVAAFVRYWTRKEAVLKATGDGLLVPLRDLTVADHDQPPRLTAWAGGPAGPDRFHLHDLDPGPGYAASLAVLGTRPAAVHELDGAALLADPAPVIGSPPGERSRPRG